MSVVVEKEYRFIPPHRGSLIPSLIQRFRLVDLYLARKYGVVEHECRNLHRFMQACQEGKSILLAPNHCRYSDPLVLGWPARHAKTHLFAMASWHLFSASRFQAYAIQKMGAFSILREGIDRQSLEMAIDILGRAERPLILFPEGATTRSNDRLYPLLDGVAFIARSAAKRRAKHDSGSVVIQPVAIKYLYHGDIATWVANAMGRLEKELGWRPTKGQCLSSRVKRIIIAVFAMCEVRYLGRPATRSFHFRKDDLVRTLLDQAESRYGLSSKEEIEPLTRIRKLRSTLSTTLSSSSSLKEREVGRHYADITDLAQRLHYFPHRCLDKSLISETEILEALEGLQEILLGRPDFPGPFKVIIDFGEPIPATPDRCPRGDADPLLSQLAQSLSSMLGKLACESRFVDLNTIDRLDRHK